MLEILQCILGFLYIGRYCYVHSEPHMNSSHYIDFYEYGMHMEGEEIAYTRMGFIPPFTPLYIHNITIAEPREDLEKEFTYLRVEYISLVSPIKIIYNATESTITFHILFPFLNIPFGIIGYSLNVNHSKVYNQWNDTSAETKITTTSSTTASTTTVSGFLTEAPLAQPLP
ncbi:uncharacterized protein LOC113498619 isoform X2 [Trichoplusia ni]|uniref:Uncharacterized protein LOC113498619 isoform X2 n=1 Tax=Trichoplusia ni TaxID=7111 RepID=A0A7E5W1K1_TRINI|nr:uncharacterized protein LOC113498619 isoform X2 [Trichoplusia ni]